MTFHDCLMECAKTPELVAEFNRLSGCNLGAKDLRSPLDRMIDEAAGYDAKVKEREKDEMAQFISFVYDCIWIRLPGRR